MFLDDENIEQNNLRFKNAKIIFFENLLKQKSQNREYKSNWDQFCDFTSLVGFRLLHSKNSTLLRYS